MEGLDRLMARLVNIKGKLDPAIAEALTQVAENIKNDARAIVPIDTGSLQKSIRRQTHAKPAGDVHRIGVSAGGYITNPKTGRKVDYAAYVEYGTSRTPAQPFLTPAVEKHKPEVKRILGDKVKEACR